MSEDDEQPQAQGEGFRGLFPGFFPPRDDRLAIFFIEGLVAFDTNALFDAYRLGEQGRREFFDVLRLLGDRLWIPHQVAQEFLERRSTVLAECAGATKSFTEELATSTDKIKQQLRTFGNRRGVSADEVGKLVELVEAAEKQLGTSINDLYTFDIPADARPEDDPIFCELEQLLNDKIGPGFSEQERAKLEAEGKKRFDRKIPPGWADNAKAGDRKYGDFLLWEQAIHETERRKLPLLLVSNDEKDDWVHRDHGRKIGPQPALVKEMRDRTTQPFHLVNVRSFLVNAKQFLNAEISDSTVEQAEHLTTKAPAHLSLDTNLLWQIRNEIAHGMVGPGPDLSSTEFALMTRLLLAYTESIPGMDRRRRTNYAKIRQQLEALRDRGALEDTDALKLLDALRKCASPGDEDPSSETPDESE